jgi:Tol biopolymer transport system component
VSASKRHLGFVLLIAVPFSACGSAAPVPSSPTMSPTVSPTMSPTVFPTASAAIPTASAEPLDPLLNALVVTVSDRVRVRSEPRVSDDSIMYEPVLPLGTELTVLDGPVNASGFTWYKVAPVSFVGLEGPGFGWVALAGTDGEPWIALAQTPTAVPGPTSIAFDPISAGKIAFMSTQDGNPEIYTVNPDGSGLARLTYSDAGDIAPAWSPDGTRIAFGCGIGPETDGGIRWVGPSDICLMDADGRRLVRLTNDPVSDGEPTWSPDGSRIAFRREGDIYTMKPDGADLTRLTTDAFAYEPAWSPDGTKIAFTSRRDLDPNGMGNPEIYVMDADGTGAVNLTRDLAREDGRPAWSPDGTRIAYDSFPSTGGEIAVWLMNADGSDKVRLPPSPGNDSEPAWSPDGTRIVFTRYGDNLGDIFIRNADGSGAVAVTNFPGFDGSPDWQPTPEP